MQSFLATKPTQNVKNYDINKNATFHCIKNIFPRISKIKIKRLLKLLTSVLQPPFLGPPSTRLAAALSGGSCQCQAAALQLAVHLQELETAGLGEESARAALRRDVEILA